MIFVLIFCSFLTLPVSGWSKCESESGETKICGTTTWPTIDWKDGRKTKTDSNGSSI